ncbi:MAG: hypothetical protein MJZ14_07820 [Paludibacteraceae bacterium]|nr:hypothetical protein [Paludibacteraceae bacterium]
MSRGKELQESGSNLMSFGGLSFWGSLILYWLDWISGGWTLFILFVSLVIGIVGLINWLLGLARRGIDAVVEIVYNGFLDLLGMREQISMRCPDAVKAVIKEKKQHAVDVGIYNSDGTEEQLRFQADSISSDLRPGNVIYLR